ncbi:MFS transporter [Coprobacter sp.]
MESWKRKFIIIWTGQLFSILSSSVAQFAIILWISLETRSAEVLSLATIFALLPQIILGPLAGVYVDRWSRKWTMILADSFVALCSAVIAILFYYNVVEIWHIYILLMLRSVGSAFHAPAMKSSVPLLAPDSELTRIAGINQAIQSVCNIGGPAIGAALIIAFDMSVVMLLDVAGAAIACIALLFVVIPNPPKTESGDARSLLKEMHQGFREIYNNRGLSWVMATEILTTFFIMPIIALLPLMTLKNFGGGTWQVSIIEIAFGAGMLVGGVFLGIRNPSIRKTTLIYVSLISLGITFWLCGLLPSSAFQWYVVLTILQGLAVPFYSGPFTALLQEQVDAAYLGRVFSLFDSVSLLPSVVGLFITGFIADAAGIPNVFVACGIAVILIGIVALFIPSVRKLEKKKPKQERFEQT